MWQAIKYEYDNLNPTAKAAVKYTGIVGLAVTAWRTAMAFVDSPDAGVMDVLNAIADLVSLPWRFALSLIGDLAGAIGLEGFESVTDRLIADGDGDGKREGVGGEFVGMINKVVG